MRMILRIYAVIPRPLSRPRVLKSLNQDLATNNSWCLKWHMRLTPEKIKVIMVGRSRTTTPGYGDLSLGGAEFEEVKSLHILVVTLDSKLTFETHLWEVVSKASRSLGGGRAQSSEVI